MPLYHVTFRRETLQVVEVEAETAEDAQEKAMSDEGRERPDLESVESIDIESVELAGGTVTKLVSGA